MRNVVEKQIDVDLTMSAAEMNTEGQVVLDKNEWTVSSVSLS